MRNDASPTIGLVLALGVGAFAASRGRSGARWGALANAAFFILWDLSQVPPSPTGGYLIAATALSIEAVLQGLAWGVLWGAIGHFFQHKFNAKSEIDGNNSAL